MSPRMTENEIYHAHIVGFLGLLQHHARSRYAARLASIMAAFGCDDLEGLVAKWGKASPEAIAEGLADYRDSAISTGTPAAEVNAGLLDARAFHRSLENDGFFKDDLPAVEPAYPDPVPAEIVEYSEAAVQVEDKKGRTQRLQDAATAVLMAQAVPVTQIQNLDAGDVTKNGIRVKLAHWIEHQVVTLHPDALKIVAALAKLRKKSQPLIEGGLGRRADAVTILAGWRKLILQYDRAKGERTGAAATKGSLADGAKVHRS